MLAPPGYYPKPYTPNPDGTTPLITLPFHGGGYFPAAWQDGLTAYSHLLHNLHILPQNIILSGESAGANLVLGILRYLSSEESAGILPLPKAALLWSPWVDMRRNQLLIDSHPSARTDCMKSSILEWGARSFVPPGWDRGHAYLSPLENEFKSPVLMFLQSGTAEVVYEDRVKFVHGMSEKGGRVEYLEIENAPHDTFGAGIILGWVKEAEEAAARFVEDIKYDGDGVGDGAE